MFVKYPRFLANFNTWKTNSDTNNWYCLLEGVTLSKLEIIGLIEVKNRVIEAKTKDIEDKSMEIEAKTKEIEAKTKEIEAKTKEIEAKCLSKAEIEKLITNNCSKNSCQNGKLVNIGLLQRGPIRGARRQNDRSGRKSRRGQNSNDKRSSNAPSDPVQNRKPRNNSRRGWNGLPGQNSTVIDFGSYDLTSNDVGSFYDQQWAVKWTSHPINICPTPTNSRPTLPPQTAIPLQTAILAETAIPAKTVHLLFQEIFNPTQCYLSLPVY